MFRELNSASTYDFSVDMWSAGALVTALFAGEPFFSVQAGSNIHNLASMAQECDLSGLESGREWRGMGSNARDLVKNLLVANPAKRLKAGAALNHEWFAFAPGALQQRWETMASKWQDSRASPASPFNDIEINVNEMIRLNNLEPEVSVSLLTRA